MKRLDIEAFAKLNLGLRVLGQNPGPDGYHELKTVFQSIDLSDRMELSLVAEGTIDVSFQGNGDLPGERDLVARSAEHIMRASGRSESLAIRIHKSIPIGAGLGGGSSDAAATLVGVNQLLELGWSTERLVEVGARLGADVPFFLHGGRQLGRGRGDRLIPLADPAPFEAAIVIVGGRLETREVFEAYDRGLSPAGFRHAPVRNDLEPAALRLNPALECTKAWLEEKGLKHGMSGSGSSYFALLDDLDEAVSLAKGAMRDLHAPVHVVRPVPCGCRVVGPAGQP